MLIHDSRKPSTIEFGALKNGEVFHDSIETGDFCMKISEAVDSHDNNINAIELETGLGYWFEPMDQVVKVSARLEIF